VNGSCLGQSGPAAEKKIKTEAEKVECKKIASRNEKLAIH